MYLDEEQINNLARDITNQYMHMFGNNFSNMKDFASLYLDNYYEVREVIIEREREKQRKMSKVSKVSNVSNVSNVSWNDVLDNKDSSKSFIR